MKLPGTAHEAAGLLRRREVSSLELTEAYLARVGALDERIGAFLALDPDGARRAAGAADERLASGRAEALTGIPWACKDVISTQGLETTAGSRILKGYLPPFDATVAARLRAAGAVMLGKTNCDEFAMGSSNENSAYGPVHNPADLSRVPGGSSGGSAAAVASEMALFALGTDTGGIDRVQLGDGLQDRRKLAGEAVDLLLAERQTRQLRDIYDRAAIDAHASQSMG